MVEVVVEEVAVEEVAVEEVVVEEERERGCEVESSKLF